MKKKQTKSKEERDGMATRRANPPGWNADYKSLEDETQALLRSVRGEPAAAAPSGASTRQSRRSSGKGSPTKGRRGRKKGRSRNIELTTPSPAPMSPKEKKHPDASSTLSSTGSSFGTGTMAVEPDASPDGDAGFEGLHDEGEASFASLILRDF